MIVDSSDAGGTELVVVSAADEAALVDTLTRIVGFLDRVPDASLVNIAYTCSLMKGPAVATFVVATTQDLRLRLVSTRDRIAGGISRRIKDKNGAYYFRDHLLGEGRGKLAFVYPGVMSFYPDMLRDVVLRHPECRSAFDELEEALADESDFSPADFIFPPAPYYQHDADIFSSGAYAQALVATYAASVALTRLLGAHGLAPDGVVGCAGGDLGAVMRSGSGGDNGRAERIKAIRDIYRVVDKAVAHEGLPQCTMLSVVMRHAGDADVIVGAFPKGKVTLAIDVSPRRRIYAVDPAFEEEAMTAFAQMGIRAMKMKLDRPFNTVKCERIVPAIKKFAGEWVRHEPVCDVYSCATAERLPVKPRIARNDTAERWAKPVRFTETIRRMHADGYRVFLEVGPRGLMTSAVDDILAGEEYAAIALNSIHRRGLLQVQHGVAQLIALGAKMDVSPVFARRGAKTLDFDGNVPDLGRGLESRLSRAFPKLTLFQGLEKLAGEEFLAEPRRGAKVGLRAAAVAERQRKFKRFEKGAMYPLISDAEERPAGTSPGISSEIRLRLKLSEMPFLGDLAYGSSQLSYSYKDLKGLVLLQMPVGAEIMAEIATRLIPDQAVVALDDFRSSRQLAFANGVLDLVVHAERTASPDPAKETVVKVQIRELAAEEKSGEAEGAASDRADAAAFTWPAMEANVILSRQPPKAAPADVAPLMKPRFVHWSNREIYPEKLCCGKRQRGIVSVESWGEEGLDYQLTVPSSSDSVAFTLFPQWQIDPLLLQSAVSGFMLWRSQEMFPGAFSFPFSLRRLELKGPLPAAGAELNCYLRLASVTPQSHLCDITVTSGDGNEVMEIIGWEERTTRVPKEYCEMVLQPAKTFLTEPIPPEVLGDPATRYASAFATDVPFAFFERNEQIWLRIISNIVLSETERVTFCRMKGDVKRRIEWLFGRIAVKEAVRRFMKDRLHARWSYADVEILRDQYGKPYAKGEWEKDVGAKLDVAIAHTAQFVVALAASNARIGIDVESVARDLSKEFADGVFTDDEQNLAADAAKSAHVLVRFWCAKEAVSKALGTGIRYSPRELIVTGYNAESGQITVQLTGAWLEGFKMLKNRDLVVSSRVMRDHAVASCFIPSALFPDDEDSTL